MQRIFSRIIAGVLCVLSWSAFGQTGHAPDAAAKSALPAGMTYVRSVEGIDEYQLKNGLQVLMLEDASKPSTTVNLTVKVGSRYEHYGETGMAHLLEHMMFKGTPHYGAIMGEFQHRGLEANGTTAQDRTNYFASMADNPANLDFYLHWLADAFVHSNVARKDLDSEMTVVRNEMERGENDPGTVLYFRTLSAAYWWHAYGHVPIGARTDVENVDIAHLQAFYHKYYQPDNAVLIVTGKFDPIQTRATIARTFGAIPRPTRVLEPTYTLDPVQDGEHTVTVRRAGGAPIIYALYHTPAGSDPRYASGELASEILGGPEFRLNHSLVEKGLAADVGSEAASMQEPGFTLFEADLKEDQPVPPAEDALLKTVEGVAAQPFTADEVARAKNIWLRGFDQLMADPQRLGVSLSEYVALGDWRLLFLRRDQIKAASVDDVNNFAKSFFLRSNRTVGMFIPTADSPRAPPLGRVDVAGELKNFKDDTSTAVGEAFDTSPANLAKRTEFKSLDNHVQLGLLSKKTRGAKVIVRIGLRFGDEKSLFGHDLAGTLTASMLSRGTTRLSREALAAEFEKLGATWSVSGNAEGATLSLETTHEQLDAALALAMEVLKSPRFDPAEFEQLRSSTIQGIQSEADEPATRLSEQVAAHANTYPKGDVRYPMTSEETIAELKTIKLDAVVDFYHQFYGASDAVVTAVGDFDDNQIVKPVTDQLVTWKSPVAYVRVPRPFVKVAPAQLKIETPDKQNAVMLTQLSVPLRESDTDFQALRVANEIFGGGVGGTRLGDRIRQKDGLSYSVESFIGGGQYNANTTWGAEAIFAPQNEPHVRSDFYEELARAQKDGFTETELKQANESIRQQLRLARAQDRYLVSLLDSLIERQLDFGYLTRMQDVRDKLTVADINAAFDKYVVSNNLVFGVAGDFNAPALSPANGSKGAPAATAAPAGPALAAPAAK